MKEKHDLKINTELDLFESDFTWYVWNSGYYVDTGMGYYYLSQNHTDFGKRAIYPLRESSLLFEAFASIDPDEKDYTSLLNFTNNFGLLEVPSIQPSYKISPPKPPSDGSFMTIHKILDEVRLIRFLLAAWEASQENASTFNLDYLKSVFTIEEKVTESGMKQCYATFELPRDVYRNGKRAILCYSTLIGETINGLSTPSVLSNEYPRFARTLVMQYLNDLLWQYPSVMQIIRGKDNDANHNLKLKPLNLLSAIWLQFSQYVTSYQDDDGSKIVRCEFCGERGYLNGNWRQGGRSEKYRGLFYHIKCHNKERQREYRKDK